MDKTTEQKIAEVLFRALDLLECDAHDFFKECEAAYQ